MGAFVRCRICDNTISGRYFKTTEALFGPEGQIEAVRCEFTCGMCYLLAPRLGPVSSQQSSPPLSGPAAPVVP